MFSEIQRLQEKSKRLPVVIVGGKRESPDLIISPGRSEDELTVESTLWEQFGRRSPGYAPSVSSRYLLDIVYGGAVYYWVYRLAQEKKNVDSSEWPITLKWFKNSHPNENLLQTKDRKIEVAGDTLNDYSCQITNEQKKKLYIHVFRFDCPSHSISTPFLITCRVQHV